MGAETIIIVVQVIAALGVVVSVVYLGIQIHQQNEITKAQFGHSLTQRQYERYFATAKDSEFADFLAKDWSEKLTHGEEWRASMFIVMALVDIFDVYEKFNKGFVDEKHLTIRINALKLGTMKTPLARAVWDFWKVTRDTDFINWFENEMFDKESKQWSEDGGYVPDGIKSSVRRD